MPNAASVKQELNNYITARTPLVIVSTNERERVERILREIANDTGKEIWYYTDARQVRVFGRNSRNTSAAADTGGDPLGFFLDKLKKTRELTAVLGDVRRIAEDNLYSHQLMNLLYTANETAGTVILVTSEPVWGRIASFGMLVSLDLPDMGERIGQIRAFVAKYRNRFPVDLEEPDISRAAAVLRGFSEIQIDNILSAEMIASGGLRKERITRLGAQKQKYYGMQESVQYIRPGNPVEAAGMGNLKKWLNDKRDVFFAPEELLRKYDLKAPKGILLVGVPGCGKSMTAKLVAQNWELPLFRFDIGSVFDKWVGESEKKMRESLQFIDSVSPCILWIDEIEKVLATSDSGNETGKRVLGEFLFWLQESDSKVFLVATANNVSVLPYELYRKGRISEVFFSDLPGPGERAQAFRQYIKRSLILDAEDSLIEQLTEISDGYSYADIETAVKNVALEELILKSRNGHTDAPGEIGRKLISGTKDIIPISDLNPEMIGEIREWGEHRARNVSIAEEESNV